MEWIFSPTFKLQVGRCNHAVVSTEDVIYSIGGHVGPHPSSHCEQLDVATGEQCIIAPLCERRACHAASLLEGQIYVTGGKYYGNDTLQSAEIYSFTTNQWTLIQPMNLAREEHCSCAAGGKLIVFGGGNSFQGLPVDNTCTSMEVYDPVNQSWSIHHSYFTEQYRSFCAIGLQERPRLKNLSKLCALNAHFRKCTLT